MPKKYADADAYEAKLEKVMARMGVEKFNYDWNRNSCWVEFWYKGQLYRFEHSIENAKAHGQEVHYGSDVFAQIVLTLEDLARMAERGIYELQTWIAGLKALPAARDLPDCIKLLGFTQMPEAEELKQRYRQLVKAAHPDAGGDPTHFQIIKTAYDQAVQIVEKGVDG